VGLHRELLASGVRVEFDSAFRWKAGQGNPTRDLVVALLPEFPDQIMLGMDAARRGYWRSYGGGPGLSYLLTDFSAQLRAEGVSTGLARKNLCVHARLHVHVFPAMKKLRVVGLNFDHMHMGDLLRKCHDHPGVEIAGICDENPARMAAVIRNFGIPAERVFTDPHQVSARGRA
jgi:hypothetical protein